MKKRLSLPWKGEKIWEMGRHAQNVLKDCYRGKSKRQKKSILNPGTSLGKGSKLERE
jgi:hypothetical protein